MPFAAAEQKKQQNLALSVNAQFKALGELLKTYPKVNKRTLHEQLQALADSVAKLPLENTKRPYLFLKQDLLPILAIFNTSLKVSQLKVILSLVDKDDPYAGFLIAEAFYKYKVSITHPTDVISIFEALLPTCISSVKKNQQEENARLNTIIYLIHSINFRKKEIDSATFDSLLKLYVQLANENQAILSNTLSIFLTQMLKVVPRRLDIGQIEYLLDTVPNLMPSQMHFIVDRFSKTLNSAHLIQLVFLVKTLSAKDTARLCDIALRKTTDSSQLYFFQQIFMKAPASFICAQRQFKKILALFPSSLSNLQFQLLLQRLPINHRRKFLTGLQLVVKKLGGSISEMQRIILKARISHFKNPKDQAVLLEVVDSLPAQTTNKKPCNNVMMKDNEAWHRVVTCFSSFINPDGSQKQLCTLSTSEINHLLQKLNMQKRWATHKEPILRDMHALITLWDALRPSTCKGFFFRRFDQKVAKYNEDNRYMMSGLTLLVDSLKDGETAESREDSILAWLENPQTTQVLEDRYFDFRTERHFFTNPLVYIRKKLEQAEPYTDKQIAILTKLLSHVASYWKKIPSKLHELHQNTFDWAGFVSRLQRALVSCCLTKQNLTDEHLKNIQQWVAIVVDQEGNAQKQFMEIFRQFNLVEGTNLSVPSSPTGSSLSSSLSALDLASVITGQENGRLSHSSVFATDSQGSWTAKDSLQAATREEGRELDGLSPGRRRSPLPSS